jgi:hypothetical protein
LDAQTVSRLRISGGKAESENLEHVTERIIVVQDAAGGGGVQLLINMPLRGRVLSFTRPLQVKPNAPMVVTFDVETRDSAAVAGWGWTAALGVLLFVALSAGSGVNSWVRKTREKAAATVPEEEELDDFEFEEVPPTSDDGQFAPSTAAGVAGGDDPQPEDQDEAGTGQPPEPPAGETGAADEETEQPQQDRQAEGEEDKDPERPA